MTDRLPIKVLLTIIEATDPEPVLNKSYKKMSVKASTDMTGEEVLVFTTFRPSIFEIINRSIGKSIECDVLLGERKIVGIQDDKESFDRDATNRTQTVIRAVADIVASANISEIPDNVMSNHWKLIEKWQSEALR